MKTPAPHSGSGHSRLRRLILPFSSSFEDVGEPAFSAVLPVEVAGHENSGAAFGKWALMTETVDLAVLLDLVESEGGKLDLGVLVLDLLGGGVVLLLALL